MYSKFIHLNIFVLFFSKIKVDENHFQMMLQPGEGFVPTDNELQTLTTIDQRLQCLLPEEEFRSISNSVLSTVPQVSSQMYIVLAFFLLL